MSHKKLIPLLEKERKKKVVLYSYLYRASCTAREATSDVHMFTLLCYIPPYL